MNEIMSLIESIRNSIPGEAFEKFKLDMQTFLESYDTGVYNPLLCEKLKNARVSELIKVLKRFPPDSKISLCGANTFYIHVPHDKEDIILDTESDIDGYTDFGNEIKNMTLSNRSFSRK